MSRKPRIPREEEKISPYDAAPFPARLPRRISERENQDWGLDEVCAKIPQGTCIMIMGTRKP